MTGAEMVLKALSDQGVEHVFGYPGGAVLPIYDEMFQQDAVRTSWFARKAGRFMLLKAMRARPVRSVSFW
jgi:glyoxylate carboligase